MTPLALLALALAPLPAPQADPTGAWRAAIACPGGDIAFGLEVERTGDGLSARLVNGSERIDVPEVLLEGDTLVLALPHYDSRVEARLAGDGLAGTWRKRRGPEAWTEMVFRAERGAAETPAAPATADAAGAVDGRWSVRFSSSEDPAVGIFSAAPDGALEGTFLTTTGDYRYLAGRLDGRRLRLSCFDGAHAFLFTAELSDEGVLSGDFWSRDTWHETWTAVRDDDAALPDPYAQTEWRPGASLADAVFPDLDGVPRSLADPAFAGRARLLVAFGTWCPNCNDEAPFLAELEQRYGPRGLSIVGLAFELTGDFERDAEQVRRFRERHGVRFPILVAGLADKEQATRAFPLLDFVRSYPTTIFLHADGRVRAVHSGYAGPATGEAHARLRSEFEGVIEELLAEEPPTHDPTWAFLAGRTFVSLDGSASYGFRDEGGRRVGYSATWRVDPASPVGLSASSVAVGDELLRIDREAGILYDPRRFERRFAPQGGSATPSLAPAVIADEPRLVVLARSGSPARRREALVALALLRESEGRAGNPVALGLVGDPALEVALAAAWSTAKNGEKRAVPVLLESLADPNAALRREATLALGRLGAGDDEVRAALDGLAGDPDPLVREAAAEALALR